MPEDNNIFKKYKETVFSKLSYQDIYGQIKCQKEGADGWTAGLCPFHNDTHPSFSFNKTTLAWKCHAGCGQGSVFDFLMQTNGWNFWDTLQQLGAKYNIASPVKKQDKRPAIEEELVQQWVKNLRTNEELKRYLLEERGLSDETLKKYQIGWDHKRQRYSFPIRDEHGTPVNIRFYNSKMNPKIINYVEGGHKYGSPARLYGLDELVKYEKKQVALVEGEIDRLLLIQAGIFCVTGTHGCGTFMPEWINYFKGKDIVIIYDIDTKGREAVKNIVLKALKKSEAASVKVVQLPLKGTEDDKDVSDYIHKRGFTGGDLQQLINDTNPHKYEEEEVIEELIPLQSFVDIEKKEYINKRVQCEITICGETNEAFHATEQFKVVYCPKLAKGECFDCAEPITVKRGRKEFIGSCMSTDVQVTAMLRTLCCRYGQKATIEILKSTTIKEFFCHQKINRLTQTPDESDNIVQYIDGRKQELMEKKVYYISSEDVKPGSYMAEGYVKSHPKTQQITFLIESLIPEEDDFQSFDLEKNLAHLKALQQLSWAEKLADLTDYVTKIYQRDEILITVLITYCSPLWLRFNNERIRGWIISAVIGDSGSGKTQTYSRFSEFVNIGDCFSGLTGTRTGLAYALVDNPQRGWQVKIGRYPANNGKILIVDETQFLPDWDLRVLAKATEEGFMQIDRVASKGYESMTRLVMLCNPKKDNIMDTFTFGCESLASIFPATIIRRIDLAVFLNSADTQNLSFFQKASDIPGERRITPEMMRALIFWAWNLKEDQIIFDREAELLCLAEADRLGKIYGAANDIPLVLPSDFRKTLARISAAFAVICVSEQDNFKKLVILSKHVKMAVEFLTVTYSHESCGLDEYAEIQKELSQVTDYEEVEAAFLKKKKDSAHDYQNEGVFPQVLRLIRYHKSIKRDNLIEQAGCSAQAVSKIVRFLKKYNLLESKDIGYVKTPKFNRFLKAFLKKHPDFLPKKGVSDETEE